MAKGVPQIEQGPFAKLALIPSDNGCLAAAAHRNGMLARGTAVKELAPIVLQPAEKLCVGYKSVFGELGVASAKFTERQRVQKRGVGHNQNGLMKGADQI